MKKYSVLIPLILSLSVLLCGCKSTDYKKAVNLYAEGAFAQAASMFTDLGDYKDSHDMYLLCRYSIAMETMAEGDYEYAIEIFESLGSYKDSEDKILECRYAIAQAAMDKDNLEDALALFDELGSFSDAGQKSDQCRIALARKSFDQGIWRNVVAYLTKQDGTVLGTDDAEVSTMMMLSKAHIAYEDGDFDTVVQLLADYELKDDEPIYTEAIAAQSTGAFASSMQEALDNRDTDAVSVALSSYYENASDDELPRQTLSDAFTAFASQEDFPLFQFMDSVLDATTEYSFHDELKAIVDAGLSNRMSAYLMSGNWLRTNGASMQGAILEVTKDENGALIGTLIDTANIPMPLFFDGDLKWKNLSFTDAGNFELDDYTVNYNYSNYAINSTTYYAGHAMIDYASNIISIEIYAGPGATNGAYQTWEMIGK